MFPEHASNTHAKPFKSITPPTGDTFIVVDVSVRFAKAKGCRGGEKQTVLAECGVHVAAQTFQEVGQRERVRVEENEV